jgi:hypothetical protein
MHKKKSEDPQENASQDVPELYKSHCEENQLFKLGVP